jgi:hypothetical protein
MTSTQTSGRCSEWLVAQPPKMGGNVTATSPLEPQILFMTHTYILASGLSTVQLHKAMTRT